MMAKFAAVNKMVLLLVVVVGLLLPDFVSGK